ncbi:hypothetical protein COB21_02200 [Candidatus Aerophobetes bacterium]|uniref:FAD synthase n=1 Tax=Aerophobetes bacterium TaxID=2030807 RepID=A0A2A4X5W5_UNCAE|nr:MAG: hypothetical protein COB21_02200 [Candidatus Aerophobetes bacterium]
MKIFTTFDSMEKLNEACALSIGVFDGIHLGHQRIIKQLHKKAGKGCKGIVTFDKRPASYFNPLGEALPIMTLEHRLSLLEKYGLDFALVLCFDHTIADLSFESFLQKIMDKAPIKNLILGENASFGKERGGNETTLPSFAHKHAFNLTFLKKSLMQNNVISSTLARNLVTDGNLKKLKKILGRRYTLFTPNFSPKELTKKGKWHTFQLCFENLTALPSGTYTISIENGYVSLPGFALLTTESSLSPKRYVVDVFFGSGTLQQGPLTLLFINQTPPKAQNHPLKQFEHSLSSSLLLQTSMKNITTKE